MDSAIQTADERMERVTEDGEAVRAYWRRTMALCDYASSMNYAAEQGLTEGMAKGRSEGLAEGRAEEKLAIARKMKEMGDPAEKIQIITGLPPETVARIT